MNALNEHYKIQARHVKFDFSKTPIQWVRNDPCTTHIVNTLNLIFPEGELWFCRVYNKALPLITDPQLKSDAEGFLRQEAVHSRSHNAVLKHYYEHLGIDTKPFTNKVQELFTRVAGDKPFGITKRGSKSRWWLRQQLAVIACLEHFFGYAGNWVLNSEGLERAADPAVLDLLRWHGAEEVEHRMVAFNIYQHFGGNYLERCVYMTLTFAMLLYFIITGAKFMWDQDPATGRYPGFLFSWWNASRRDRLPSFFKMTLATLRYYMPGYTPAGEGSTEQALAYLARSPAASVAQHGGNWAAPNKV